MRALLAHVHRRRAALAALGLALASARCGWQTYAVTRSVREVTGAKTRIHVITPVGGSLRSYRVIEVTPLVDLIGDGMPPSMERYVNDRMITALSGLPSSPAIEKAFADGDATVPTIAVDGFVDDYEAGSRAMRVVELGFNHIAVTLRIRLRDKRSGQVLGAASVTAEDDRASGTVRAAIDHASARIRAFVEAGYAR
jgi:hypothetical protein